MSDFNFNDLKAAAELQREYGTQVVWFSSPERDQGCCLNLTAVVAEIERMRKELRAKDEEIERLKSGAFTEEEFQNLCHNRFPCSRAEFEDGCQQYTDKLYGPLEEDLQ